MSLKTNDIPKAEFTDDRTDMAYWFPKVRELDVPTPESCRLPLDRSGDGPPEWGDERAIDTVEALGGEAFVRSGYKSAQHGLDRGSHIRSTDPEEVARTLLELASQHVMMRMPFGECLWLREWIDVNHCHYSRENLVPEARAFVRDGKVVCHHPRLEGFEGHEDHRETAEAFIESAWPAELEDGYYRDHEGLETYARRVADAFDGDGWWSVDFVMDTNGDWWLTDMALDAIYNQEGRGRDGWGNISEHPGDCPLDLEAQFASYNEREGSDAR